ncbi:bis(5'-nucleosyl)-tetraphosphatase (symmetrical) YqeK [bacterium]|nr:bis(5'-nucleosyl)-tetraphosphatase (symmetrical) YqeK [bacterium]MCB2178963.1 bis(5'-nucleosyl)-tetraphosphatase (symmetrical) YqeK [bacterium]
MHPQLQALTKEFSFSGSIPVDAAAFLKHHECPRTAEHVAQVASVAVDLARQFGVDETQAAQAGWLHDISAVYPNSERLGVSQALGLEVLPVEAQVPLLLHQKISAVMAEQLFGVQALAVLEAIRCHTTLKGAPGPLDLVLFVADKLAWDQKGEPPYAGALTGALAHSLEEAAWVYQDYLIHSGKVKMAHPWMLDSHRELKARFGASPD